jgi:hypothetical protein
MTDLEQSIISEISTLPDARLNDVLAFVRFLKVSLYDPEKIRSDFKEALKDARATAKENNISQADIEAEIRAVRAGK